MTTNGTTTCTYSRNCPSYDFHKCCSAGYMGACKELNFILQQEEIAKQERRITESELLSFCAIEGEGLRR